MNSPNITVIRSRRKTISIEITRDLRVIVRAPMRATNADIGYFVNEKSKWIDTHLELMRRRAEEAQLSQPKLTAAELAELKARAKELIPARVERYAPLVGVSYGRIAIRSQTSRWGSCSAKGNLNFNCLLMLAPQEVLDYVIVHELCHRKELNHSARFWAEVALVDPHYAAHRKWLKEQGGALIQRIK